VRRLPVAIVAALLGRRGRQAAAEEHGERIVPEGEPAPLGAELLVAALLVLAAICGAGFVVAFAVTDPASHQTQYLGLALGLCLVFLAAAAIVFSKRLVLDEDVEEDYPEPHPQEQAEVREIVRESGSRITRKRLLLGAGGLAGAGLTAAVVAPVASLGPVFDTEGLRSTAWKRGKRLVDERDKPLLADDIEPDTFYTAYPDREGHDRIDAPVIVVRLDPSALKLPADRASWAPEGILAFSKICTHAGCAVSMYRKPLFAPADPRPALVCPCHYSTFDPATGGDVIFGPAGRPLPQLPLLIDPATRELRAAGEMSGPVGPSWSGVRGGKVHYDKTGPEGVE
jgi:ubiquinol-cytochrome c reductase iron-sulfur subunit